MNREFQAVYRETMAPNPALPEYLVAVGEVKTVSIIAVRAEQVRDMLEVDRLHVISVTEVRAIVDWEKPIWDLDEFAAAMGIKGGSLSGKKGNGKIPWSKEAGGVTRRAALGWVEKTLNESGRAIVKELESA